MQYDHTEQHATIASHISLIIEVAAEKCTISKDQASGLARALHRLHGKRFSGLETATPKESGDAVACFIEFASTWQYEPMKAAHAIAGLLEKFKGREGLLVLNINRLREAQLVPQL